ncbi:hypothetical protein QQS21_010577 [Conoideocrella luteorostrata]|uniref:SET domain-containing protein n=1 Tax=Conoideocrella luteorostrata TaxID=1105319 RepID=A0AAJ0CH24_9HYPO|nr:hypothetical protein QQS21_010577 [Conoideocrella luteorostrata]
MVLLATHAMLLVSALATAVDAKIEQLNFLCQTPVRPLSFSEPPAVPKTSQGLSPFASNASKPYHVYSAPGFADGRGISIITSPDRIKHFQRVAPFAPGTNDHTSPPYKEELVAGKGRGLVATKMFHRGDKIFADTPILLIDADIFEDSEDLWVTLEEEAVRKLPLESQRKFWELHGQPVQNPIAGRIDPNAFELNTANATYYAVLPEIARLNHDCRPNAAYFFDQDTLTHHVHAITDIPPGTELSITYIDPTMHRKKRVRKLLRNWGFQCSCSQCSASAHLSQASDRRLSQIVDLSERLEDGGWENASPEMAEALVSLYEQERLYASGSESYTYAALTYCAEGKLGPTIKYAHLAVEYGILDNGFHDVDVEDMRELADAPEKQDCWMQKMR